MKLNEKAFAFASIVTIALLWLVCSLLVYLMPDMSMQASGSMMHMDLSTMQWSMTFPGFLVGLIIWSLAAGVVGWIFALLYNMFV